MDGFAKNIAMMWLILGALQVVCAGGYLALRLRLNSGMDRPEPRGRRHRREMINYIPFKSSIFSRI